MIDFRIAKLAYAAALAALFCGTAAYAQQNINPNQQPKANVPPQKAQPNPKATDAELATITFRLTGGGRIKDKNTGKIYCDRSPLPNTPVNAENNHTCSITYALKATLDLVAEPQADWQFDRWQIYNTSAGTYCAELKRPDCHIASTGANIIYRAHFVPAQPKPIQIKHTVDVQISGPGKVTTLPFAGDPVNCEQKGTQAASGDCKTSVTNKSTLTLQATPSPGYQFKEWKANSNGKNCLSNPVCTFPVTEHTTAVAFFVPIEAYLTPDNWPKTISTNGKPALFKGKLVNKINNAPLANVALQLKFDNKWSCKTTTLASGQFACSLSIDGSAASQVGLKKMMEADALVSAHKISIQGSTTLLIVNDKGYTQRIISGNFFKPILQGSIPGGVLLNNYAPGNTNYKASTMQNGSRIFLTTPINEKQATVFDIPRASSSPYYYYVNNVLVRTGTVTLKQPNIISIPLSITGYNGHGPSIKGHCDWSGLFEKGQCGGEYDGGAPDATGLALNDGLAEVALSVNAAGQIQVNIVTLQGTIDFNCGGIVKVVCGSLKPIVNTQLQIKMKELIGSSVLQGQINATLNKQIADFGIAQLREVEFTSDGGLIVRGIPAGS